MDVLFMRWFGWDTTFPAGFSNKCLHRISFITNDTSNPDVDSGCFGFVNPDQVIHGVHFILAYAYKLEDCIITIHSYKAGPMTSTIHADGLLSCSV
jgi:hypothetical protein